MLHHVTTVSLGWDGICCGYWCRHRSKGCSKAPPLPCESRRKSRLGCVLQWKTSSTVAGVQRTLERPVLYYTLYKFRNGGWDGICCGYWCSTGQFLTNLRYKFIFGTCLLVWQLFALSNPIQCILWLSAQLGQGTELDHLGQFQVVLGPPGPNLGVPT